ncbi:MAG: DASH family cryptochrome [Planctomycetota bacterium]|nr:DASH family cryptochrome [Planctomycetota bacterium]
MAGASTTVVWFRRDLRTRDHAPLIEAVARGAVVCVYFLDEGRWAAGSSRGRQLACPRVGPLRTRFLLESLQDLRRALRGLGAELVIRSGAPQDGVARLLADCRADALYYHRDVGSEEAAQEAAVCAAAAGCGAATRGFWDRTLVAPEDLSFAVEDTPESFSAFRKKVERERRFAAPRPAPARVDGVPGLTPGELPSVRELAGVDVPAHPAGATQMRGGEGEAWRRIATWCWERDRLRVYKQTRNGMLGGDDSSRWSPWLSHGCVSARSLQAEVARYEAERVQNESTYWMTFELLWRDYFQWMTVKHGAAMFRASGLRGCPVPWQRDEAAFGRWRDGQTGFPIVDACMRELRASGFMSNRGRQIVTSFLTKNLGVDWRWGAEWFESQLIDYDVGSNYGNWNYGAGVGNDSRGFRYFNLATQAQKYDPDGAHARRWLSELRLLPPEYTHAPWRAPRAVLEDAGVTLGRSYPRPMVDLDRSAAANRASWERAERAGCP